MKKFAFGFLAVFLMMTAFPASAVQDKPEADDHFESGGGRLIISA